MCRSPEESKLDLLKPVDDLCSYVGGQDTLRPDFVSNIGFQPMLVLSIVMFSLSVPLRSLEDIWR